MFSVVSSQFLASASWMSSAHDVQSHVCFARARASRMMSLVVSSCCVHLVMWAWSVWPRVGIGVGYCSSPSSVGPVKGREAVDFGRCQAALYACVHFCASLFSCVSVHGMRGLRNLKVPIALEVKMFTASWCSRRCPVIMLVASSVFLKTLSMDSVMLPFAVA